MTPTCITFTRPTRTGNPCLHPRRHRVSALIDRTGTTWGLLTVIARGDDYISPQGARQVMWVCRCACGVEVPRAAHNLKRSRGCFTCTRRAGVNEVGNVYGRLTAIARAADNGDGWVWLCRCACGAEVEVRGGDLRAGKRTACGRCVFRCEHPDCPGTGSHSSNASERCPAATEQRRHRGLLWYHTTAMGQTAVARRTLRKAGRL